MANHRLINLAWIGAEKFGVLAVSVFSFLVYAFSLSPAQMGMAALAIAIVESFGVVLGNLLEDPLVRQQKRQGHASAFWYGAALALGSMSLIGVSFFWFASDWMFIYLIWYASLKILLVILARPFIAVLRQQRNFKALAARTLVGKLAGAVCGIVLALWGAGAWAVVSQALVMDMLALVMLMRGNLALIRGQKRWSLFVELVVEGFPIAVRSLCKSSLIRGVTIVLGVTTSAATVGYFAFANRLVSLPSQAISNGLLSYAMPVIARRHRAGQAIGPFVNQLSLAATLLLLPCFFIAAALGPVLIEGIFGQKWLASVFVFQVLCVIAGLRCIVLFVPSTLAATGNARTGLNADILNTVAALLFILLLGSQLGVMSALVALGAHMLFDLAIKLNCLKRVTATSNQGWFSQAVKIVLAASLMLWVSTQTLSWLAQPLVAGSMATLAGGVTFGVMVHWLTPQWRDLIRGLINKNAKGS